jgi:hypothetical protein
MSKDLNANARFHKQDVSIHFIFELIRVKAKIRDSAGPGAS